MRTRVFGKHGAMLNAGLLAAIMVPTGMSAVMAEASHAMRSGHVELHQVETSAQLHPSLSSNLNTIPTLRAQRQELLEKIIVWIKANPRK